ncbi:hypothetical protein [Rudanella lutea]|uniref:hypothetical protein n=1 Tax=Rudanella lutea TaxID=451374 RepID=UPI00035E79EA|nr:hypothetical protein [Rudanella lutea]
MAQSNNTPTQSLHPTPLINRVLVGAALGLVLISVFLLTADEPDPNWPQYWMVRPLLIVPMAGGLAGGINYALDFVRVQGEKQKIVANIASILIHLIGLFMGFVLGLDGTMWN